MSRSLSFAVEGRRDGPHNMGADRLLFERAESDAEVGCRVYGWTGAWVSLGRFQVPERDLLCPAETRWVMRPTGGKAVLHGHDLTVGMAVPFGVIDVGPRGLKACYRWMAAPIVEALRSCGVPASLGEHTAFAGVGKRTADCFTHVSANDIVHETLGTKVCGCALLMGQSAVLMQASIPQGPPLVDPRAVIREAGIHPEACWDSLGFGEALELALRRSLDDS